MFAELTRPEKEAREGFVEVVSFPFLSPSIFCKWQRQAVPGMLSSSLPGPHIPVQATGGQAVLGCWSYQAL
jgi:hypothetical protein